MAVGGEGPRLPGLADGQAGFVAAVEELVSGTAVGPFVGDLYSGRAVPDDVNDSYGLLREDACYLYAWFEVF
jgi:hypothetical protein